jgi:hypothetical protein
MDAPAGADDGEVIAARSLAVARSVEFDVVPISGDNKDDDAEVVSKSVSW